MPKNITLNKLAEEIIRESKRPFTINDFAKNLATRWEKQISDSSLKKVRQILINHHSLIGIKENDFVPCRAVIEKINHVALSVPLGTWELKQGLFIPGHRLMPFLLADRKEEDLTFVDAEGNEIQKLKQLFPKKLRVILINYGESKKRILAYQKKSIRWFCSTFCS